MSLSHLSKFDSELSNSIPSYNFDINKFSPSLRLMHKLTVIAKNSSPTHRKFRKDSDETPKLSIKPFISTNRGSKTQTNIETIVNQSPFYLNKPNLQKDSESDLNSSNMIIPKNNFSHGNLKLSAGSSYLIYDNYGRKNIDNIGSDKAKEQNSLSLSVLQHKFKKLNEVTSSLNLSNETYFSPYHIHLCNTILTKRESFQSKEIINELEESIRFPFELSEGKHIYFQIHNDYHGSPIHFNCNIHKGNFQAYISQLQHPSKELHDITFNNVRSCCIALEKMCEIEYIYVCISALTDLKMSVDYYFEIIPQKEDKKKQLIEIVDYNYNKNNGVNDEKSEINSPLKTNIIKKNKFFIKKLKTLRIQESKYKSEYFASKANYVNEKKGISQIFSKIIKNLKNEHKVFEEQSKIREHVLKQILHDFQINWMKIILVVNFVGFIYSRFRVLKKIDYELKDKVKKILTIQRFFRIQKLKRFIIRPKFRLFINCFCSTLSAAKLLKRKLKKKCQTLMANTFKASIFPLNLYTYFFKVIIKIISLQKKILIHRKNEIQRIHNLKGLLDKYAFSLDQNDKTRNIYKKYEEISLETKMLHVKNFIAIKNAIYTEKMKEYFKIRRNQTKKETLALKFFSAETEQCELEEEINSSLLVRSNMSYKKAMEQAQKSRKMDKPVRKKTIKKTFLDNYDGNKPVYDGNPTQEEVLQLFNQIIRTAKTNSLIIK